MGASMSEIKNGGPAFPFVEPNEPCSVALGMSLRDYFAAKWMQGWIACPNVYELELPDCAKAAYRMADAMLKAREEA